MIHSRVDKGDDLRHHNMSLSQENEINFQDRNMHKTAFYNTGPTFQSYFAPENGYHYDTAYGQTTTASPDSYYAHSSCAMQNSHHQSPGAAPEFTHHPYPGSEGYPACLPNPSLTCASGLGSQSPVGIGKQGEIYPWMKESRQNSKQRQAQQQQQQQQQTQQPSQNSPPQTSQNAGGRYIEHVYFVHISTCLF